MKKLCQLVDAGKRQLYLYTTSPVLHSVHATIYLRKAVGVGENSCREPQLDDGDTLKNSLNIIFSVTLATYVDMHELHGINGKTQILVQCHYITH